jgi:positive regulator of sigma E activity
MTNSATAELYFIAAMMILILIISTVATYLFFRQYKKEMREKDKINERARKESEKVKKGKSEKVA